MLGLLYVIIAEFFWATELVLIRRFFSSQNPFLIMTIASLIGSLFYLPTLLFIREKLVMKDIIILVIYGFTSWFLAQVIYVKGIQQSHSAFAVALTTLTLPLFAVILGHIFLKEALSPKVVIGGILMAIGFLLISAK